MKIPRIDFKRVFQNTTRIKSKPERSCHLNFVQKLSVSVWRRYLVWAFKDAFQIAFIICCSHIDRCLSYVNESLELFHVSSIYNRSEWHLLDGQIFFWWHFYDLCMSICVSWSVCTYSGTALLCFGYHLKHPRAYCWGSPGAPLYSRKSLSWRILGMASK